MVVYHPRFWRCILFFVVPLISEDKTVFGRFTNKREVLQDTQTSTSIYDQNETHSLKESMTVWRRTSTQGTRRQKMR